MRPIIVDLFAGGGGASMGIEMALGRAPDVAINHDPVAIAMHEVNHPETEHYCNDIWEVDPARVRPGEPVGLLWASPDCKHFSKAKGGKPKDRNIRDLAWVVVKWAEIRKPDVIIVENVEEFSTWGPLDNDGRIIPEFAGQTFEDWLGRLKRCGYKVEWRESRASSYGAPTIRKRLCIVASRIGKPRWPKATHGDPQAKDFNAKAVQPWRTAAEDVIDWSLVCPSIFDSKKAIWERHGLRAVRPLAKNTGARVARGIRRYVLDAARPFIVGVGGRMGQSPERSVGAPMQTITAKADSCICVPTITRFNTGATGSRADEPLPTVTANSYLKRPGGAAPLGVVAGGAKHAAVAAFLAQHNTGLVGHDAREPVSTIVQKGCTQGVVAAHMLTMKGSERRMSAADEPIRGVCAGGTHEALISGALVKYYGTDQDPQLDEPLHTVTVKNRFGLAELALAAPPFGAEHEARAREVAAFMREHGQWNGGEFVTLELDGATFVIADIGLRMLTPRELFNAQGFPRDYRIDRDNEGRVFSKSDQIGRAGNSVSPPWAAAHVAANCAHLVAEPAMEAAE